MSIPLQPVTVKFAPDDLPILRKMAEYRGMDGVSEYVRHLVLQDRDALRKQRDGLNRIFDADMPEIKESLVCQRTTAMDSGNRGEL
jgi:hypothetical protein